MKRLQNPKIMDDDRINMEDIKHQDENENVTIENKLNKKTKEERIKKMLTKVMAIHGLLAKNFFEVHLKKKMAFLPFLIHFICYVTYSLSMKCPIWTSIFFNKTLVSTNVVTLLC
jgi:hypothetical protein